MRVGLHPVLDPVGQGFGPVARAAGTQLGGGDDDMTARLLNSPADGAIAQLGERLLCKQEVAGSIPAGSIPKSLAFAGLFLWLSWLRVILGWLGFTCVDQAVDHASS